MCPRTVVLLFFILAVNLQSLHGDPNSQQCQCLMVTRGQPYVQNAQPIEQQNIGDKCSPDASQLNCNFSIPYRYLDGRCNNVNHPAWGMTNSTVVRLLPALYSTNPNDPPGTPRRSAVDNTTPLKSARTISNIFFPDRKEPSRQYTLSFMIWSQIYSHDVLSLKLRNPPPNGCCVNGTRVPQQQWDPGCLAIEIEPNDDYYKKFNVGCFPLIRAQFSSDFGCNLPEIEHGISVPSYFDGSVVYGTSAEIADQLRLKKDGKLKYETTDDGRVFLPHTDQANNLCFVETNKNGCFQGSDFRVNQHAQLSAIQVVLLRVHNKLCDELKQINADILEWQNDEKLYQEAKRIVTAIMQHSIFGRFSEIFFGRDCAIAYGFSEDDWPGYYSGYDPELNPGTLAEFEHVAWRAFHSIIEGTINLYNDTRQQVGSVQLSDWVNNPTLIKTPGILDEILIGMSTQAMEGFDRFYSPEITEEFFKQLNNNRFGIDLLAIDCERGRELAIQDYVHFATLAGYPIVQDFDELIDRMDPQVIEKLRSAYATVQDIDALVGSLLEKPYGAGMVGKTLLSVVAEQFRRHKFGDSFFYSFKGRGEFTPKQLAAIKSTTLAFFICYGSDNIGHMQKDVYTIPSQTDQLPTCNEIVEDFLSQLRESWKDNPTNKGSCDDVDIATRVVNDVKVTVN